MGNSIKTNEGMAVHALPTPLSTRRRAILEAALALFVERGFHGTAVPSIASRAGVGAGTIYRYFSSKEVLVNELYREQRRALATHLAEGFPSGEPPRTQFHAFWTRLTGWAQAHPQAFAFLEFQHHDYLDESNRRLHAEGFRLGVRFIERAQRIQALKAGPPELLVGLCFGALAGMLRAGWNGAIELDEATLRQAEQCCWEALKS